MIHGSLGSEWVSTPVASAYSVRGASRSRRLWNERQKQAAKLQLTGSRLQDGRGFRKEFRYVHPARNRRQKREAGLFVEPLCGNPAVEVEPLDARGCRLRRNPS